MDVAVVASELKLRTQTATGLIGAGPPGCCVARPPRWTHMRARPRPRPRHSYHHDSRRCGGLRSHWLDCCCGVAPLIPLQSLRFVSARASRGASGPARPPMSTRGFRRSQVARSVVGSRPRLDLNPIPILELHRCRRCGGWRRPTTIGFAALCSPPRGLGCAPGGPRRRPLLRHFLSVPLARPLRLCR